MSDTTTPSQVRLRGGAMVDRAAFDAFMRCRAELLESADGREALRALHNLYSGQAANYSKLLRMNGIVEFDEEGQPRLPEATQVILAGFPTVETLLSYRYTPLIPATHVVAPGLERRWPTLHTMLWSPDAGNLRLVFAWLCVGIVCTVATSPVMSGEHTVMLLAAWLGFTTGLGLASLARQTQQLYVRRYDHQIP